VKSKPVAFVQWIFFLLAVFFWALYLMGHMADTSAVIASISSVIFGVMFCLELFD
jgi:hypothetical protein